MNEPHRAEEFHGEKFKIWATKGWREPKKHTWKGFSPSATECCYGLIVSIQMESTQSICGQPQTVSCQAPWRLYRYRYKKGILEHFFLSSFFPLYVYLLAQEAREKNYCVNLVSWNLINGQYWPFGHAWRWKSEKNTCLYVWGSGLSLWP